MLRKHSEGRFPGIWAIIILWGLGVVLIAIALTYPQGCKLSDIEWSLVIKTLGTYYRCVR